MSLAAKAVRARALGDTSITALISDRWSPVTEAQGLSKPFVHYTEDEVETVNALNEKPTDIRRHRVRVTAEAANYSSAHALADLIRTRLDGYAGSQTIDGNPVVTMSLTVRGQRDILEPVGDGGEFRPVAVELDLNVWIDH